MSKLPTAVIEIEKALRHIWFDLEGLPPKKDQVAESNKTSRTHPSRESVFSPIFDEMIIFSDIFP